MTGGEKRCGAETPWAGTEAVRCELDEGHFALERDGLGGWRLYSTPHRASLKWGGERDITENPNEQGKS